jgi:DNA-binding transcriptional LysR family regulator
MQIDDLQLVLKVAEFKSIKKAADSLDIRVAAASAAVKRVEKTYGIELFVRSTRSLRLSAAGEKYLPQIESALVMLNQIGQSAKEAMNIVDGELRLAMPSDLGRNIVLPWLDQLAEEHSGLRLKLHISDHNVDFYREPVDLALRYGAPKDSTMYGFKICDAPRVLCASPAYLEKHGAPERPQDLTAHNGLLYELREVIHDTWEFCKGSSSVKVKMKSNRMANDAELVRRWCVAGYGIASKSALDMSEDLLSGKLTSLMPEYQGTATELWLICPSRQLITPAVRLLREHLTEKCAAVLSNLKQAGHLH